MAPVAGAAAAVKRPVSELEAENARLRRELAKLARAKLDLEIVKNRLRGQRRPLFEKHATRHCQTPEVAVTFLEYDPVKKPGSGKAPDPMLVAFHTTPFRKVI